MTILHSAKDAEASRYASEASDEHLMNLVRRTKKDELYGDAENRLQRMLKQEENVLKVIKQHIKENTELTNKTSVRSFINRYDREVGEIIEEVATKNPGAIMLTEVAETEETAHSGRFLKVHNTDGLVVNPTVDNQKAFENQSTPGGGNQTKTADKILVHNSVLREILGRLGFHDITNEMLQNLLAQVLDPAEIGSFQLHRLNKFLHLTVFANRNQGNVRVINDKVYTEVVADAAPVKAVISPGMIHKLRDSKRTTPDQFRKEMEQKRKARGDGNTIGMENSASETAQSGTSGPSGLAFSSSNNAASRYNLDGDVVQTAPEPAGPEALAIQQKIETHLAKQFRNKLIHVTRQRTRKFRSTIQDEFQPPKRSYKSVSPRLPDSKTSKEMLNDPQADPTHPSHMYWLLSEKQKRAQQEIEKKREIKLRKAMQECTFVPKISRNTKNDRKQESKQRTKVAELLYERALLAQDESRKREEDMQRTHAEKELANCTFHPETQLSKMSLMKGKTEPRKDEIKGFGRFVSRSRLAEEKRQEEKQLRERVNRGENYRPLQHTGTRPFNLSVSNRGSNRKWEEQVEFAEKPDMIVEVKLENNKMARIALYKDDLPSEVVNEFCLHYFLDNERKDRLERTLQYELDQLHARTKVTAMTLATTGARTSGSKGKKGINTYNSPRDSRSTRNTVNIARPKAVSTMEPGSKRAKNTPRDDHDGHTTNANDQVLIAGNHNAVLQSPSKSSELSITASKSSFRGSPKRRNPGEVDLNNPGLLRAHMKYGEQLRKTGNSANDARSNSPELKRVDKSIPPEVDKVKPAADYYFESYKAVAEKKLTSTTFDAKPYVAEKNTRGHNSAAAPTMSSNTAQKFYYYGNEQCYDYDYTPARDPRVRASLTNGGKYSARNGSTGRTVSGSACRTGSASRTAPNSSRGPGPHSSAKGTPRDDVGSSNGTRKPSSFNKGYSGNRNPTDTVANPSASAGYSIGQQKSVSSSQPRPKSTNEQQKSFNPRITGAHRMKPKTSPSRSVKSGRASNSPPPGGKQKERPTLMDRISVLESMDRRTEQQRLQEEEQPPNHNIPAEHTFSPGLDSRGSRSKPPSNSSAAASPQDGLVLRDFVNSQVNFSQHKERSECTPLDGPNLDDGDELFLGSSQNYQLCGEHDDSERQYRAADSAFGEELTNSNQGHSKNIDEHNVLTISSRPDVRHAEGAHTQPNFQNENRGGYSNSDSISTSHSRQMSRQSSKQPSEVGVEMFMDEVAAVQDESQILGDFIKDLNKNKKVIVAARPYDAGSRRNSRK